MEEQVLLDHSISDYELDIDEYRSCIEDLYSVEQVKLMAKFPHHKEVNCLEHSLRVSIYSYNICKTLGLNKYEAARGALLHDLFLYDWHKPREEKGLHGFHHPKVALRNARKIVNLSKMEEDIILKHMFPLTIRPPKYVESMIVCLVDKFVALIECIGLV